MNKKAEIINSASIYVEGLGFIAHSAKAKLPEIEFAEFTHMSGVSENTSYSTILKQMKATLELIEENKVYFEALSKRTLERASFDVKYTANNKQVVVTLKGSIVKMTHADIEVGKENVKTIELTVDFFKKETDGYVENLIDLENMICEINGTDVWATQREFLVG